MTQSELDKLIEIKVREEINRQKLQKLTTSHALTKLKKKNSTSLGSVLAVGCGIITVGMLLNAGN